MKERLEYYFGETLTDDVKLFNMASFLSAFFSFIYIFFGAIFRFNNLILVFLFICSLTCTILFFLERFKPKTVLYSIILLVILNIFCLPIALLLTEKNCAEVPIYYFIGITFGLVLLNGKKRIIYIIVQLAVDFASMIGAFLLREPYDVYYSSLDTISYVRLEFAIIGTAIICGSMILFRNYLVKKEIIRREQERIEAENISYAKDIFLVNVSHEIRTPLNAIIGTTDMILDSDVSNHIKEMAYNISNSSHALLSITSDLLDFSRINEESLATVEKQYDLALMMNDVINLMNVRLLDSNVEFYVDVNPNLPRTLIGDSGKIRQIFVNMLSNSVKYTKSGHMIFRADFEQKENNTILLHIEVEDTGIGIKPDMIEKIFEAYNRSGSTDTDHAIEGNGLGLCLCKKLAKAMNGEIWAESEYGKGSIFHLDVVQKIAPDYHEGYCGEVNNTETKVAYLPVNIYEMKHLGKILESMKVNTFEAPTAEALLDSMKSKEYDYYMLPSEFYDNLREKINATGVDWSKVVIISACNYSYSGEPFEYVITKPVSCLNLADLLNKSAGYALRKRTFDGEFSVPDATILIIDDNLVNLQVASSVISRYKAKVITAASGREGIITLCQEKVDLVFLDYMMPDMDGIDTLKEIRALEDKKAAQVPVVALTANVVSGAREMFLNAGFNSYMSKPIEVDKIEKALITYLPGECIKYKL